MRVKSVCIYLLNREVFKLLEPILKKVKSDKCVAL